MPLRAGNTGISGAYGGLIAGNAGVRNMLAAGAGAAATPASLLEDAAGTAPSLVLYSDLGVSSSGGTITGWADQSGNGNDFTVGDGNAQINATPAVDMDGTGDYLTSTFCPSNTAAKTIIFVVKHDAAGNTEYPVTSRAASEGWMFYKTTGELPRFALTGGRSFNPTDTLPTVTDWYSWAATHDGTGGNYGTACKVYANGSALAGSANGTGTGSDGTNMFIGRVTTLRFPGEYAAVIVFPAMLNDAQVAAVHNVIRTHVAGYATPISLPSA